MGSVASAVSNVLDKADNWLEGDAVGNAVSSVADVVTDAAKTVGNAVEDTAQAIGNAGEQLDKVVGDTIPGGWMTVGLVAGTIATAGALGAGSAAATGAASGAEAAAAASAATSFAGAGTATVSSVATGILESAAMGALKGAAVGGISSVLQGDSILEGALSGAASGALGGGVGGVNQVLDFNPFVEQAIGSVAKAAASPQGLERSLDKIAFNALAGYGGSELGISPSVAVPAANLARAAAEGKDVSQALKNTAINYVGGKVAGEIGKQVGNVADELKEAVGYEGYGSGGGGGSLVEEPRELTPDEKALNFAQNALEVSVKDYLQDLAKQQTQPKRPTRPTMPRTGLSARELMEQGYSWDPERQLWKRPIAAGTQPQQQQTGEAPLTPQQLAEMGYVWDAEKGAYRRPKQIATEYKDPYSAFTNTSDLSLAPYQDAYKELNDANDLSLSPYEDPLTKQKSDSTFADIFDTGENDTEYAIDKSMSEYVDPLLTNIEDRVLGEYIDPMLAKKPTTNIMAGGAPLQTGSGGIAVSGFSEGGSSNVKRVTDAFDGFIDKSTEDIFRYIRPGMSRGNPNYTIPGYPFGELFRLGLAEGGSTTVQEHKPEFFSEGGLNSLGNTYVSGKGDGTSDSIPAMLANGEFVIPADVVSSLGNGSNDSGAKILDEFLKTIRAHKRKADPKKLPPDSKGPLGYLLEAKKRAKK